MTGADWLEKDFYKVLGVSKDADESAIKKAYRKLARKYHPDQNPGDSAAEEQFKKIGEAYSVLSDSKARAQYDSFRAMGGGARFHPGAGGAGGAAGFEDLFSAMFGGSGSGPNIRFQQQGGPGGFPGGMPADADFLSSLFAGGGPGGTASHSRRGADLSTKASLTFRQAATGTKLRMTIEGRTITVRIPAGVKDGQRIRIAGRGRPGADGGADGDLLVNVTVAEHPVFRMDGKNLRLSLPVSFAEATLGTILEVPLLDGTTAKVKVPAGTANGTVLRLRGKGIETSSATGDLLIEVSVVVPQKLSKQAKQVLKEFEAACGEANLRDDLLEQAKV